MTRTKIIGLVVLTILLVGTAASWFLLRDYFAKRQKLTEFTKGKMPVIRLSLPNGRELALVPLKENHGPFASESPITNAQYAPAVAEKGVAAPELPENLRPAARTVNPKLPAIHNPAPWERVAWHAGKHPEGQESNAVLFVTLDEAKAYCSWLEKKFPEYHFRLPDVMECHELETEKTRPNQRLSEGESAFPRPTTGPQAIRIKERFWLSPWTDELHLHESWADHGELGRALEASRFSPTSRYHPIIAGSFGTASVIPNTFRVVAVKKEL